MLTIGLMTPPVGMLLFVTSNIAKISLAKLSRSVAPFALAAVIVVLILAYCPALVTFIPNALGM